MVRDERGKPAEAVSHRRSRPDVRRRGDLHRDARGLTTGGLRAAPEETDAPRHQTWIGELDDRAVGDPAGDLERLRAVAGDPHAERVLRRPIEPQGSALVHDLAALAQVAD